MPYTGSNPVVTQVDGYNRSEANALLAAKASLTGEETLTNKTLTNPVISGGAYFGGTATANLLDDYEEGTWTPVLSTNGFASGATPSSLSGSYTKFGNVVEVQMSVTTPSSTYVSGLTSFNGLPFPAASNGSGSWHANNTGGKTYGAVGTETSQIRMYAQVDTSAATTFIISATYIV